MSAVLTRLNFINGDSPLMNPFLRKFFDQQLDQVFPQLPPLVHKLLSKVPLVVEDYPSQQVMRKVGVRQRSHLCGLYTGIPITKRSIEHSGILSDVIHIYREGILSLAQDGQGDIDEKELRKQIRITILHERGHHHGLEESELEELGYYISFLATATRRMAGLASHQFMLRFLHEQRWLSKASHPTSLPLLHSLYRCRLPTQ